MDFGNRVPTDIPTNDYSPMPEGWYQAQIVEEKEKTTANNGVQLIYTFNILGKVEGSNTSGYNGRKVWNGYNVVCPGSPKAEEIAYTEIARLAKACGVANVRNSSDLVTKICEIRLVISQDPGYQPRNEIKGYRSSTSQAPVFGAPAPQAPAQQAPAAQPTAPGSVPPWERR